METIINKISSRTAEKHLIYCDPFDASTYSAAILLREKYRNLDVTVREEKDWRYLFIVKRHFLRKAKKDGKWTCHYCKKDIFKKPLRSKKRQSLKDCVTIDHKIPASECEDKLDTKNFLPCCYKCNQRKGFMSYEEFKSKMDLKLAMAEI